MTNVVATIERQPKSVLVDMATRFGMEPAAFEQTVRATVIKSASREEFAAFLLVAKEYNLNPLTKEIYAFPAKGGGIVPVVSIDGWVNLINSHGASDGFEFEYEHAEGKLISCTCKMFRKDRSRPIMVTEYLSECIRGTEPWKMQHRMLRHKALIQAARYAFGFSGIYDEDEGERIVANRAKEVQGEFTEVDDGGGPPDPSKALAAPSIDDGGGPPAPGETKPTAANDDGLDIPEYLRRTPAEPVRAEVAGIGKADLVFSDEEAEWLESLDGAFSGCEDMGSLSNETERLMKPYENSMPTQAWNRAVEIQVEHITRIQASDG